MLGDVLREKWARAKADVIDVFDHSFDSDCEPELKRQKTKKN